MRITIDAIESESESIIDVIIIALRIDDVRVMFAPVAQLYSSSADSLDCILWLQKVNW